MYIYQDASNTMSLNKAITKTFLWMATGLMVTAFTSFVSIITGLWYVVLTSVSPLILMILQVGIAIWFTASMKSASPTKLKVLFMAYAVTLGITLTPISLMYSSGLIFIAFMITAILFASLAIVGMTTKKDLTKLGTICMVGLITLVITQLIMMLFHVGMETRLFSVLGLIIFTGLTAWDMQRMKMGLANTQGVMQEKLSIYMAFEIYLDFINIFLYVLELLGIGSRND